ncbi:MGDG synthase family glycosyltransferase [Caloramator mitchellensis]|nr:glycosyltransferase [Caloramator mitchellensis]
MKILALTVSAGKGHQKAAEALKKYYAENNPNIEFEIVDTLKYINPIVDKLIVGGYLKSLKKTPKLYGKLYYFSENEDAVSAISNLIHDIFSIKFKSLLEEINPDLVLCTHPFPIEIMSILKKKGKTEIKTAAILTDYAPHPFWFQDYIDAYIIPHEDFIDDLINLGVPSESIHPLGIPICNDFAQAIEKNKARDLLGLEDKTTILIMGGGLGIGNIKSVFESLIYSTLDIQIIAVAGYNARLKNQLLNLSNICNKKTKIFGYTDEINLLMSASDLIITKPGGLTITEALIKNLPMLLISPIPGQEEKNAEYLLNCGIAAYSKRPENITITLKQLLGSSKRLTHMKEMASEKAKPNAVEDIAKLLIDLSSR